MTGETPSGSGAVRPGPAQPARRPARLLAEVHDTESVSASMRRIRLVGDDLARFAWPGPASHLKLLLPGDDTPWPRSTVDDGQPRPFLDPERVVSRTYTPRHWDPVNRILSIDIFVHGHGAASRWARAAGPGDRVAISVPKARFEVDQQADWIVLAGDESAAPALGTILEAESSQGRPIQAFVETSQPTDSVGLGPEVTVVGRGLESPGIALQRVLRAKVPAGPGQVWVAGEAASIRAVRRWLARERGLAASFLVTRGYWRLGETNHPDHDFGE